MFELIAAPLTPLTESGELNLEPVTRYTAHLRATGCTGALVAGSTGEGPSLTGAERRRLAERWIEAGSGCGPVRPPLLGLEGEAEPALRAELEGIGFFGWIREPEPS